MAKIKAVFYLYEGEKVIGYGTAKALGEKFHISADGIRKFATPKYAKRFGGNGYIAVKVGTNEEEKSWE